MPRKKNGLGNFSSGAVKSVSNRTDIGKAKGAAGLYPSDRQYGASVNRSVIEKWDLDSDWVKWRKGFEYYYQTAWFRLTNRDPMTGEYNVTEINSKLYQGTDYEIDVVFDGYKFPTKDADSNNHYVMKRSTTSDVDLGTVTKVYNDQSLYPELKANREIRVHGTAGADSRLLFQMIGERLTDGQTEATLDYVLTNQGLPSLLIGKSWSRELTEVVASVDKAALLASDFIQENRGNLQALVGKFVYMPSFYIEKDIADINYTTKDISEYFGLLVEDSSNINQEIVILDNSTEQLPPSLLDISSLPRIFTEKDGGYSLKGTYVYEKALYQKFYGTQYLTAELAIKDVSSVSYTIMPYEILSVADNGTKVELKSYPFQGELKLYKPTALAGEASGILVFTDYSFTKRTVESAPLGIEPWIAVNTDVDPWMDEVFTSGKPLKPSTLYSCSCPSHSQSILRAPQSSQNEGERKINRQLRYPLPTALGQTTYDSIGSSSAAGIMESWESREHRMGFKMCKHSIAAMFIDHIKIIEPNKYPTYETRLKFEEKLKEELEKAATYFDASYRRGGVTSVEVVFAMAKGLNLDDTETAYVMLNTKF